jgi:prepilin-type N-terminal cleavage/methylation domain-containing protein
MKRKQNKSGLTLVEILVAVAIITVLAAGLYSVSNHLETQAKEKLTKSTIELLSAALEQYHDFYSKFPFVAGAGYGKTELQTSLSNGTVWVKNDGVPSDYSNIYSSSEALYYFLNQIPASRKIVDSINHSLLTNKGDKGKEYFIRIGTVDYPLIHILDPWQHPFRYTYTTGDNFPVITSAGPDANFVNIADNISSK